MLIEIDKDVFVAPDEVVGIKPEIWCNGGVNDGRRWSIYGSFVRVSFKSLPELKIQGPHQPESYEEDGKLDYSQIEKAPREWASSKARELFIMVADALKNSVSE